MTTITIAEQIHQATEAGAVYWLVGWAAIEHAERIGVDVWAERPDTHQLHRFADDAGPARMLTIDEARRVAAEESPHLVWCRP